MILAGMTTVDVWLMHYCTALGGYYPWPAQACLGPWGAALP